MKKNLLLLALIGGAFFSSHAQTGKGKLMLGGQISYSSSNLEFGNVFSQEITRLSIVPNVGYFVSENLVLGTGIGLETQKEPSGDVEEKRKSFVISPFGRYYVALSERFKFYGHAAVPMNFGKTTWTRTEPSGSGEYSSESIGFQLSPGFVFFPSSKVGLEFGLNGLTYSNASVDNQFGEEGSSRSSESFSIGTDFFSPRVGVQLYF